MDTVKRTTVAELRAALAKFPDDMPVVTECEEQYWDASPIPEIVRIQKHFLPWAGYVEDAEGFSAVNVG